MNKMTLIGNLTRDPEMRYTTEGTPVCNFSVAVNRPGKGPDEAEYFQIKAWRKMGESCNEWLHRGDQIYAEGPLATRAYTDRDGKQRLVLEITAEKVEFLMRQSDREILKAHRPQEEKTYTQAYKAEKQQQGMTPVEEPELPF